MSSSSTTPEEQPLPSPAQLWRATALAFLVAAVLLATIVLPAEYGIDPTGIGARIGLARLPEAEPSIGSSPANLEDSAPVSRHPAPFRTDEVSVTLASGAGTEMKATMRKGDRFVFHWTTGGDPVDFDMHGEAVNAKAGEYTSYWKEEDQESASGSFEAPFDGNHGWFWQNLGPDPVTITLTTSGFYEKIAPP